jgi:flavin-dependent dehydrogenase
MRSGRALPARAELAQHYACPTEDIVSIGLSLRMDRDARIKDDPHAALEHYAKKYPTIGRLLEGAKNLEDHYGQGTTTMSRLNYRGHASQVAGDGWLLVGDAAFFVDPLISPGLTGGVAGAFTAATVSAKALERGDCSRSALAGYEEYIRKIQPALERDNELVYMSFNHPEALALIQRVQEIDARRHFQETEVHDYDESDTNVWGILNPSYQEFQQAAWSLFREEEARVAKEVPVEEQTPRDYERLVRELKELIGPYAETNSELTPYVRQNAGRRAL